MSKIYTALLGHPLFRPATQSAQRRSSFLQAMKDLESKKIDCLNCQGTCCTFSANSMRIGREEGLDLLFYLLQNDLLTAELMAHMQETIRSYRLGQDFPSDGKRILARRLYTCPFYVAPKKAEGLNFGCLIQRDYRPYGCLAFNPLVPNQTEGGECATGDFVINQDEIRKEEKWPIPVMILKLLKEIEKEGPGKPDPS